MNLNPHPVRFDLKIAPTRFGVLPLDATGHTTDGGWETYRITLDEHEVRQLQLLKR